MSAHERPVDLDGQVALVTGASRGIGRAIAVELSNAGALVVGSATTQEGVNMMSSDWSQSGINGISIQLDLARRETFEDRIKEVVDEASAPLILVNNAGITRDGLLARLSDEDIEKVINVDLLGPIFLTRAALRGMMKTKYGRIVNVSSVVGLSGNPGQTNYGAAKAGLIGFTKSLAKEVGSRGITVNAVAPGYVETRMTEELPDEVKKLMVDHAPTRRAVTAEEVAKTVLHLVQPSSGSITGEVIRIDGGLGI